VEFYGGVLMVTGDASMNHRPKYESESDRSNQHYVLSKLGQAFGLQAETPTEEYSFYDGMFSFGDRKCVVEIKVRKNERSRYPTYMLSKRKYDALCGVTVQDIDALLAVQWTDQLGIVQLPTEHTVSTGGRYDRNDSHDVERVVLIPIGAFTRVSE
jgi:hypothetical protein